VSCPDHFTPGGKSFPVPIEQEAGWTPQPVWTFWRRKNSVLCEKGTQRIEELHNLYLTPLILYRCTPKKVHATRLRDLGIPLAHQRWVKERNADTFTAFKHTPELDSVSGFIEQAR
jgi:hypothetical protein